MFYTAKDFIVPFSPRPALCTWSLISTCDGASEVRDADELARELEEQEKHRDSAADNGRGEVKKGGQGLEGGSGGECVHASALHQPTAKTLMNGSHKPRRV
jgi:hypothetical protein